MLLRAVTKRAADWMVEANCFSEEDREVYEFGLDKMLTSLINLTVAALFGLLFGIFFEALLFYAAYITIRVYAGGYHAETPLRCFLLGIVILIPCMLAIQRYAAWSTPMVFYGLLGLGAAALVLLGPVEHKNKRMDALEKVVYRRRMLRNLVLATIAAVGLAAVSLDSYAAAVLCGVLLSASTAGIGKVKLARS